MTPTRATPKAAEATPPELVLVARAVGRAIARASSEIAVLLGDSLSHDRKGRQKRRRERD